MPKWNVSPTFNGSTTFYVTFTANPAVSNYKILAYLFGKNNNVSAVYSIVFPNVVNDSTTTATLYCGGPSGTGDWVSFPTDGFAIKADQNTFVTLTWAAASPATGTLAVLFDSVPK